MNFSPHHSVGCQATVHIGCHLFWADHLRSTTTIVHQPSDEWLHGRKGHQVFLDVIIIYLSFQPTSLANILSRTPAIWMHILKTQWANSRSMSLSSQIVSIHKCPATSAIVCSSFLQFGIFGSNIKSRYQAMNSVIQRKLHALPSSISWWNISRLLKMLNLFIAPTSKPLV